VNGEYAKPVRINGLPYLVPGGELLDLRPDTLGPHCGAAEPEAWGSARCTLAPHSDKIMHIAHEGGSIIAMWAGYLADAGDRERVEAADLTGADYGSGRPLESVG
jgi:hypothetical protein